MGVACVDAPAVYRQEPGVGAVHPGKGWTEHVEVCGLREVQRRGAERGTGRRVQHGIFQVPELRARLVAFEYPGDHHRDARDLFVPVGNGCHPVGDLQAEELRGIRRDDRLYLQGLARIVQRVVARKPPGHEGCVLHEPGQVREIGPGVVASRLRLPSRLSEEERRRLGGEVPVAHHPIDPAGDDGVGEPLHTGALPPVGGALVALHEDVDLALGQLVEGDTEGHLAQRLEVDYRARHDPGRQQDSEDHGRQQPPARQAALEDELPGREQLDHVPGQFSRRPVRIRSVHSLTHTVARR